jgi:hypothetical protein
MSDLRRAGGCLSTGSHSNIYACHDNSVQWMVSWLLAGSCQSRFLGRTGDNYHSWLRADRNFCIISTYVHRGFCAGELVPDLLNLLRLHSQLRPGLSDLLRLLHMCELRTYMFDMHGRLRSDLLDLCLAGYGKRSRVAAGVRHLLGLFHLFVVSFLFDMLGLLDMRLGADRNAGGV